MGDWLRVLVVAGALSAALPCEVGAQTLVSAVLPSSRAVQVGTPAMVFATIINTGDTPAASCAIAPVTSVPAAFGFQTTDPATNQVTGVPNGAVTIAGHASQTFVVSFVPTAAFGPTEIVLGFTCTGASAASVPGVNTLLLSASAVPGPDIVALASTTTNDGIANLDPATNAGVFAVATSNVGATGLITASVETTGGAASLAATLCQTNALTGACASAIGTSVTALIGAGTTATFGVFLSGGGGVALDPAATRVFVRFRDGAAALRGSTSVAVQTAATPPFLTAGDVTAIVQAAAVSLASTTMVIAVTDRMGQPLAVFRKPAAPSTVTGNFGAAVSAEDFALALARTGAFFSNDQAPLSSRTVRFISGIHFPPGVRNKPNAALYGIENTNRGCDLNTTFNAGKTIVPSRSLNGLPCTSTDRRGCGPGIATGKADLFDSDPNAVNGGGVPVFKDGQVVGGVGVVGVSPDEAELAAFAGSLGAAGLGPRPADPGVVVLDGINLPFVRNVPAPGAAPGSVVGAFTLAPRASPLPGGSVPDGWLVGPRASAELSQADVALIVDQAVNQANATRAAIRLPLGRTTRMMIAVTDLAGQILGLFRMPDATIFSIDVSVAKARNVVYFSGPGRVPGDLPGVPAETAVTNRTISFGAQPLFPPGIDGAPNGPFFGSFVSDVAAACSQGGQPANANQSGIVFFPGSVPLYRNGTLVGGLGVSGDGVEQDDLVSAAGATGFAPPLSIRTDRIVIDGIRLPFLKFPRNPEDL